MDVLKLQNAFEIIDVPHFAVPQTLFSQSTINYNIEKASKFQMASLSSPKFWRTFRILVCNQKLWSTSYGLICSLLFSIFLSLQQTNMKKNAWRTDWQAAKQLVSTPAASVILRLRMVFHTNHSNFKFLRSLVHHFTAAYFHKNSEICSVGEWGNILKCDTSAHPRE